MYVDCSTTERLKNKKQLVAASCNAEVEVENDGQEDGLGEHGDARSGGSYRALKQ